MKYIAFFESAVNIPIGIFTALSKKHRSIFLGLMEPLR